jgi:hypothetical protein
MIIDTTQYKRISHKLAYAFLEEGELVAVNCTTSYLTSEGVICHITGELRPLKWNDNTYIKH